jgi:hypothetical protein
MTTRREPDDTRWIGYSAWAQDKEGVWHLVSGYGIVLPCPASFTVDEYGMPPLHALICRVCLRALPDEVSAWMLQREMES